MSGTPYTELIFLIPSFGPLVRRRVVTPTETGPSPKRDVTESAKRRGETEGRSEPEDRTVSSGVVVNWVVEDSTCTPCRKLNFLVNSTFLIY